MRVTLNIRTDRSCSEIADVLREASGADADGDDCLSALAAAFGKARASRDRSAIDDDDDDGGSSDLFG